MENIIIIKAITGVNDSKANELNKLSANNTIPSIICGDFNLKSSSAMYEGITTGLSNDNYEFKTDSTLRPKNPIFKLPKKFTLEVLKNDLAKSCDLGISNDVKNI